MDTKIYYNVNFSCLNTGHLVILDTKSNILIPFLVEIGNIKLKIKVNILCVGHCSKLISLNCQ